MNFNPNKPSLAKEISPKDNKKRSWQTILVEKEQENKQWTLKATWSEVIISSPLLRWPSILVIRLIFTVFKAIAIVIDVIPGRFCMLSFPVPLLYFCPSLDTAFPNWTPVSPAPRASTSSTLAMRTSLLGLQPLSWWRSFLLPKPWPPRECSS